MTSRTIILAACLVLLSALALKAQDGTKPGPAKPSHPVNKSPIPRKPLPSLSFAKSDLSAAISVYVDTTANNVVMNVFVSNNGPGANSDGQRTVTFTAKNKGTTFTFFKDQKIPSLKGGATTAGHQAASSFSLAHSVPLSWGFDNETIYEVRISPSKTDPQPKNDSVVQVGPNKGKP